MITGGQQQVAGLPPVYINETDASLNRKPSFSSSATHSPPGGNNVFPPGTYVDGAKLAHARSAAVSPPSSSSAPANTSTIYASPEERWVERELRFYEESYTQVESLNALFITFNVGCKRPPSDLSPLLKMVDGDDEKKEREVLPDLIAVGLQEVDMSAAAMLKEETEAAGPWIAALQHAVGADQHSSPTSGALYFMYPHKQLVGLLLVVFVRKAVLPYFTEMTISTVATGALGSVGNKGAVGIRFRVHQTSICILTCHLAAGQKNTTKRNEDISTILGSMDFNAASRQISLNSSAVMQDQSFFIAIPQLLPKDHDLVAVIGDLNYRVDLSYEAAVSLAKARDIAALLKEDQLIKEMRNAHSPWKGFVDCTPTFPPTYRFDIGTNIYDTSEKQRIPAFTDRILFWSRKGTSSGAATTKQSSPSSSSSSSSATPAGIQARLLDSVPEIMSSDHKPVRAVSVVPVRVLVQSQRQSVMANLRGRVAKLGLDRVASAKTTLSTSSVVFGALPIGRGRACSTVTITNIGECVASVRAFRQVVGDASECLWLRVFPTSASILPGESVDMTLECALDYVALDWVRGWVPYEGKASVSIKSMLVLRVDDGPVHFVECSVEVLPSSFGNTLDNILRTEKLPSRVAYAKTAKPPTSSPLVGLPSTSSSGGLEAAVSAAPLILSNPKPWLPKEVWFLCDALFRCGAKEAGLFGTSDEDDNQDDAAVSELIDFLDSHAEPIPTGDDASPSFSARVVSKALVSFFMMLQQPLIPYSIYTAALSAARTGGRVPLYFVQQQLPPANGNLWLYLMSMLNFLLRPANQEKNLLTSQCLAEIFSNALFRRSPPPGPSSSSAPSSSSSSVPLAAPETGGGESSLLKAQAQMRLQLQQERNEAAQLILYFLQAPSQS
jgi:phosphatidylinositol-bisphosphatase